MNDYEKIMQIAIRNNNIFKTKMIVDAGIRKERIRELLEKGEIKRIGHGFYSICGNTTNLYYELQQRISQGIFSYSTAAFLWNLLDKAPEIIDCTVPRGYNTSRLRLSTTVNFHYVLQEYYEIGLIEIETSDGCKIRVYDKERIVCDFIKHRNKTDPKLFSQVLNSYFKSRDKDVRKLAKYGRIFHIAEKLEMYMEVL